MAGFDATITRAWADGDHAFRLGLAQLLELQEKTDAGPLELAMRLRAGRCRAQDPRETIRLGLIGAGATPHTALALVARYVDARPLLESVPLALDIITAALALPEDADRGKAPAETGMGASPLPPSSAPAPSSASPPT